MAVYEIPSGYRVVLFATMPRSGTWYSHYFIEFLDIFLTGRREVHTRLDPIVYHGLRLGKLHTHCICPGFLEACAGEERTQWEKLKFYSPGYDFGTAKFIEGNLPVFSPLHNNEIRIVYLYRNPLDQMVSFYRHIQNHKQVATRTFVDSEDNEVFFRSPSHFLRAGAVEGYIKQYQTYHFMRERGTPQLLMVPYERLVHDPATTYQQILTHLDLPPFGPRSDEAFAKSLNATTPESLRNLEIATGMPLGQDQNRADETHLRGGEIGKWREVLSEDDISFVENEFTHNGLSLEEFENSSLSMKSLV